MVRLEMVGETRWNCQCRWCAEEAAGCPIALYSRAVKPVDWPAAVRTISLVSTCGRKGGFQMLVVRPLR